MVLQLRSKASASDLSPSRELTATYLALAFKFQFSLGQIRNGGVFYSVWDSYIVHLYH